VNGTERSTQSTPATKQAEQLSTPDLLMVGNNVRIEGTNARRLYETNQIDREGLLSIVKAALKGGDVQRAYSKAKLGEEAQRGRAIEMRHDDPGLISDGSTEKVDVISSMVSQLRNPSGPNVPTPTDQTPPIDPLAIGRAEAQKALEKKRKATYSATAIAAIGIGIAIVVAVLWL